MHRNKELQAFLVNKAWQLTEEWYAALDKSDLAGVYASSDPEVIQTLKKQNYNFHLHLCKVFIEEESVFLKNLEKWILMVAEDEEHLKTPVHLVLREFFRVQEQYLNFIKEFASLNEGKYTAEVIDIWNRLIIRTFGKVMLWFVEENHKYSQQKLQAQQKMINELSSPVISLNNHTGLLPLTGEIDTERAKLILENTLEKCVNLGISHLFIDLSGVVMINIMVAHELFQLIEALKLIGVQVTLSGLRPEIAQTAVQLGLTFNNVSFKSTLSQAITTHTQN